MEFAGARLLGWTPIFGLIIGCQLGHQLAQAKFNHPTSQEVMTCLATASSRDLTYQFAPPKTQGSNAVCYAYGSMAGVEAALWRQNGVHTAISEYSALLQYFSTAKIDDEYSRGMRNLEDRDAKYMDYGYPSDFIKFVLNSCCLHRAKTNDLDLITQANHYGTNSKTNVLSSTQRKELFRNRVMSLEEPQVDITKQVNGLRFTTRNFNAHAFFLDIYEAIAFLETSEPTAVTAIRHIEKQEPKLAKELWQLNWQEVENLSDNELQEIIRVLSTNSAADADEVDNLVGGLIVFLSSYSFLAENGYPEVGAGQSWQKEGLAKTYQKIFDMNCRETGQRIFFYLKTNICRAIPPIISSASVAIEIKKEKTSVWKFWDAGGYHAVVATGFKIEAGEEYIQLRDSSNKMSRIPLKRACLISSAETVMHTGDWGFLRGKESH